MKVIINRLQFKNFWNSEYPLFVSQIVSIFQKYDIDALHLKKAVIKLLALKPKLDKIKDQELSNALSKLLQELDSERDTLIKAIVALVKTMGKLSRPVIAPHVVVMKRFTNLHGSEIAKTNYSSATKRIDDLLADYNANEDVKKAVDALNMQIFFDQLGIVNTQFATLFLQRNQEEAVAGSIDIRIIRLETDIVLTDLLNGIEFCSSEYDDLDYVTLANELNELIAYYKTQLKARATRRNEGKDVSMEDPIAGSPV